MTWTTGDMGDMTDEQIAGGRDEQDLIIRSQLGRYEPKSAVAAWSETLRAVEELFNLLMYDWPEAEEAFFEELLRSPVLRFIDDAQYHRAVRKKLTVRFGPRFADRFTDIMLRSSAVGLAFRMSGAVEAAAGFASVDSLMWYLQARRRHFVAMLHFLPTACRGETPLPLLDTFNVILPLVEMHAMPRTTGQNLLNVRAARRKLALPDDPSSRLAMLNSHFLEPERAPITDMSATANGIEILKSHESLREDRLFSAAELRNDIKTIEASYVEFDLASTPFAEAAKMVRKLSTDYVSDDFWISITASDLERLFRRFGISRRLRGAFVNTVDDYGGCLSTYAPMIKSGTVYKSSVTLLSRFLYNWRARSLDPIKRFQIRSGFIFEDAVKAALGDQGFVVEDITRINGSEFDVVTQRDGIVWNVQCKNNFTTLSSVDSDADLFARYNARLVRSYERALAKEVKREDLIKKKLGNERIQHMVVSRFPVVSDNPRIISFNRIEHFLERSKEILASKTVDRQW